MDKRLKRCPFCGNGAKISMKWNGLYQVECVSCQCKTPEREYAEARKLWNERQEIKLAKSDYNLTFGIRLKRIREKKQITQRDLAKMIDSSWHIINAVEAGTAQADPEMIVSIAQAFDITTDYLLGNIRRKNEQIPR